MGPEPTPVAVTTDATYTSEQLAAAEAYDDGFMAGWNAGAPTLAQRDELIARRITALLIQHSSNQELAAWVTQLKPYADRGIARVIT